MYIYKQKFRVDSRNLELYVVVLNHPLKAPMFMLALVSPICPSKSGTSKNI